MKMDFSKLGVLMAAVLMMACSQGVNFEIPPTEDNFAQEITYNNKVDILWIVDNSTSMGAHQNNLSAQVPALVATLNSLKMDYHMAVVTTSMGGANADGGRFIGSPKYVTNTTPDLVNQVRDRLLRGEKGSDLERGLESMQTALSPSYLANEGKGFLRSDAYLVVIALTDEDDRGAVTNPVAYYASYLDKLKKPWHDGSRSWNFNLIGILPTSKNCTGITGHFEPSSIFIGLVDLTGGIKETICTTSFLSAVANIRARIVQILTDFPLKSKPIVDTLQVYVNGQLVPQNTTNGWAYIEATNVIRFYGSAVPAADAGIRVDFTPAEAN